MQQGKFSLLMTEWFGASWKTTVFGLLSGGFTVIEPYLSNGNFDLKRDWKTMLTGVILAVGFRLSKDAHVTGGTVNSGEIPKV